MKNKNGKFIAIEGVDGSGKSTQVRLLAEYLRRRGVAVLPIKFPRYGAPGAYFVEKYLRGDYGKADALPAEVPALFYALDRFDASETIRRGLREGRVVIADRYFASNLGHQGAKIASVAKRRAFMRWLYDFEFRKLKIPKPDAHIFLDVPPAISLKLIRAREKLRRRDIHENRSYLGRSYAAYQTALHLFPRDFVVINGAPQGKLLSIHETHEHVIARLAEYLIPPSLNPSPSLKFRRTSRRAGARIV